MTRGNTRWWQVLWAMLDKRAAPRAEIVTIVLGTRVTKAVHLKREGGEPGLFNYLLREAPELKEPAAHGTLIEHLKTIKAELGAKTNEVALVLSMGESIIRHVDLPDVPRADMRQMLKLNPKHYFQQELPGYDFDVFALPGEGESKPNESPAKRPHRSVLVGGAKARLLAELEAAAKAAGWEVVRITLSQVGLVNAAIASLPAETLNEAVALVDIGFTSSTISLLAQGKLGLNRVIPLGGDKLTQGLAEALGVTYPVAEGIKTVMAEKVEAKLNELIAPLAEELRTALHFFEAQQNQRVNHVLVAGGGARSALLLQLLQQHLECPCQPLDATNCARSRLTVEKGGELAKDAPQLAAALGAALAEFTPELIQINFLAERIEAAEMARRDPFRWVIRAGVLLVVLMLLGVGRLQLKVWLAQDQLPQFEAKLGGLEHTASDAITTARKLGSIDKVLETLDRRAAQRFLWALPLSALQYCMPTNAAGGFNVEVQRLTIQQSLIEIPEVKEKTEQGKVIPGKPASHLLTTVLSITAKDTGQPPASDDFIKAITTQPYFRTHLKAVNPVRLKERLPVQVDPLDPSKSFVLFTIECYFVDREM